MEEGIKRPSKLKKPYKLVDIGRARSGLNFRKNSPIQASSTLQQDTFCWWRRGRLKGDKWPCTLNKQKGARGTYEHGLGYLYWACIRTSRNSRLCQTV